MSALNRRKFLTTSAALAAGAALPGGSQLRLALANQGLKAPLDWTKLVAGNREFAVDLYGELKKDAGNLFFSPFSISTALAMTAAGAKGTTLEEMVKVLHLPTDANPAFGAVIKSLNEEPDAQKRGFTLSTANALSAQAGYPWKDEYKKLVTTDFAASLFDMNFKGDPESARAAINNWVEKETREKIKDLLPKGTITIMTRLVLTNAIYFKGDWQDPFKKDATKDLPFTLTDGKKVEAPLMHRVGGYNYTENGEFQAIDMPYVGKRISMTVILPRKADGIAEVEKRLTADEYISMVRLMGFQKEVHLHLPRFKVEKAFNLNKPLQALGMKAAFTAADFSGMHNGGEQLNITDVVHKAFVDVNEEGTEAAAATGVVVGTTSVAEPPKPKYFRADHPFLYVIRDSKTASILFMGRLDSPK